MCGESVGLSAHHIISRHNYLCRHDKLNGLALCRKHHNSRQYVKTGMAAHGDTAQIYQFLVWLSRSPQHTYYWQWFLQHCYLYEPRNKKTNYEHIYKEILKWKL